MVERNPLYQNGGVLDEFSPNLGDTLPTSILPPRIIYNSGRFYCYTDNRWVTDSDDNYGPSYYQFNENCGTGVDPLIEQEHLGFFVYAGEVVKDLLLLLRSNNTQVTDAEISLVYKRPDTQDRWSTGIDNDGEDLHQEMFRGFYNQAVTDTVGQPNYAGNTNDIHRATIPVNFTVPEDGMISIYLKPSGTITATRYYRSLYNWRIQQ